MERKDWVIIWLSIQVTVLSGWLLKAEYKLGWLEGRNALYLDMAKDESLGPYHAEK